MSLDWFFKTLFSRIRWVHIYALVTTIHTQVSNDQAKMPFEIDYKKVNKLCSIICLVALRITGLAYNRKMPVCTVGSLITNWGFVSQRESSADYFSHTFLYKTFGRPSNLDVAIIQNTGPLF